MKITIKNANADIDQNAYGRAVTAAMDFARRATEPEELDSRDPLTGERWRFRLSEKGNVKIKRLPSLTGLCPTCGTTVYVHQGAAADECDDCLDAAFEAGR